MKNSRKRGKDAVEERREVPMAERNGEGVKGVVQQQKGKSCTTPNEGQCMKWEKLYGKS